MGNVKVLDCTLRDGGDVNNWEFGENNIQNICEKLEQTNVDIIELGFMRDVNYDPNKSLFRTIEQANHVIRSQKENIIYSALVEMANPYPLELLEQKKEGGVELLRYSFWKRCIDEAYEYASKIREKGYQLGVQPTRVEQYSDEEFGLMCRRFSALKPFAIYIVDTFGLLTKEQLIRYARIADENVGDGIRVGYHSHNNMQQAFSNATTFIEMGLQHDVVIDASIYGMGRGAGNLNLEMICNYLNAITPHRFAETPIYQAWDDCLHEIYSRLPWGYSLEYFIAAANQCNPNYPYYYKKQYPKMSVEQLKRIFDLITGEDKYLYSEAKAEAYYTKAQNTEKSV